MIRAFYKVTSAMVIILILCNIKAIIPFTMENKKLIPLLSASTFAYIRYKLAPALVRHGTAEFFV